MSACALTVRAVATMVAGCSLFAAASAYAQSTAPAGSGLSWGDGSLAPSHGYLGLHLGKTRFDPDCVPGFSCDDSDTGFKVTAGGVSTEYFGAEISYLNLGKVSSGLGSQKAQGLNLSLVGNLPVGAGFTAFGKIGTTFGWTDTSSSRLGVATGSETGFGLSYGIGVGYRLTPQLELTAEYERHNFDFAPGDQTLDLTSVGLRYRY